VPTEWREQSGRPFAHASLSRAPELERLDRRRRIGRVLVRPGGHLLDVFIANPLNADVIVEPRAEHANGTTLGASAATTPWNGECGD